MEDVRSAFTKAMKLESKEKREELSEEVGTEYLDIAISYLQTAKKMYQKGQTKPAISSLKSAIDKINKQIKSG